MKRSKFGGQQIIFVLTQAEVERHLLKLDVR